jgi:hypothetical protein
MEEDEKLKIIFNEAQNFLRGKVEESILKKQLDYYHSCKPNSINEVFKQMISTLKNKQGYVNFIVDINQMDSILFDYEPKLILQQFGDDWKKLFKAFKEKFGHDFNMNIDNKRNAWVMYSRGVLSCAKFLSNFKSFKDFDDFIKSFFHNQFTIASLPMLLEKEIFGYGFPLSCDFLKELGYVQYAKPDVHLKEIFVELNLVETKGDYDVFKKIVEMSLLVKQKPVIVDKIFWLIGSGKFYESEVKIGSQKAEFIKKMKCILNE